MGETRMDVKSDEHLEEAFPHQALDIDPTETAEWLESLEYVLDSKGPERVKFLLSMLERKARRAGVDLPTAMNTPYVNSIPVNKQPAYPGNRELERRIKSIIRWNAMAMVVRANKQFDGIGGHISTFASSAAQACPGNARTVTAISTFLITRVSFCNI